MPVDMLLPRFFEEVRRLYPTQDRFFRRLGVRDRTIEKCPVPPYRAVFTAGLLFEHAAGYRLPSFDRFAQVYGRAIRNNEKISDDIKRKLFVNPVDCAEPTEGFLHRLCGFYLDGMAHTHLYVTLVQAYEDQRLIGAVASDPRVDWKQKTDIIVVSASKVVRININFGDGQLLADRAAREADTKALAGASHMAGNPFYEQTRVVEIIRNEAHTEPSHGLRLFTAASLDLLLQSIDAALDVSPENAIRYMDMRNVNMRSLRDRSASKS